MTGNCALIVFAKAPEPGYAKTRLARVLGNTGAARLAERMLMETIQRATEAGVGPVEVCCAPDCTHPAFLQAAAQFDVALSLQGDGDLGARMYRALSRRLTINRYAMLIGTDVPHMDARYLRAAAESLATFSAVVGPVTDGGYGLIGLSKAIPEIFQGIAWSTENVLGQTRACLHRNGHRYCELPMLADVDSPADLIHLPQEWLA